MQTVAIAFACLVGAAVVAKAADASREKHDAAATGFVSTKADAPKTGQDLPRPADLQPKNRPDGQKRTDFPQGRVCFNAADTREKITAHRLTEPFRALRAGRLQGEALRARLCRWKQDQFVYEISVLRRDGRVVHVYMNALNGQNVGVSGEPDRK